MPSTLILDIGLLSILVVVAVMILRMRSLFAIVMLQGVYSLVSAAWFVSLDAVDVAFTEAAVGAGVSTVLMLAAMLLADRRSKPVPLSRQLGPLFVVIIAGLAMFYAIGDMPAYGDASAPANAYVGYDYLEKTAEEIHIPNVVTAVLASYRGFDTFGETVVIFAAGIGVLLLLGLNGNAGRWRAAPNGVNVCGHSVPPSVRDGGERPAPAPLKKTPKRRAATKAAPKKVAAKKPAAKKGTAKKPVAKKPVPKATAKPATKAKPAAKRAAPKKAVVKKTVAKTTASKKTTVKKATAKKPATKAKPKAASAAKAKPKTARKPATKAKPKTGGAS